VSSSGVFGFVVVDNAGKSGAMVDESETSAARVLDSINLMRY